MLHVAGAGVVGRHRQIPIAELLVQVLEVTSRGDRGLLRILALVDPPAPLQAIQGAGLSHELPHAASARPRHGQGLETGFGLRQVNQVLRNAFLLEGLQHHVAIAAGTGPGMFQRGLAARAGEVVDEHRHLIVEYQRQVGFGGLDLSFSRGADVGVNREGDVVGFVDGRGLRTLLGKSVTLLHRSHFQLVHRLDDLVELILQPLVAADIEVAGEHGIERLIEVLLGRVKMAGTIVRLA